ncbi:MAG: tripartite tricarboxylate transporter TctB family protein [Burkholderiaceae bacterium]
MDSMVPSSPASRQQQVAISLGLVLLAGGLAYGALSISSIAGYAGVGPNFLPWVVATTLLACALLLLREALSGGFRHMEQPSGAISADWKGFAWLSIGVLLNAALITQLGFILSCTLCFVLALRGLRISESKLAGGVNQIVKDAFIGIMIAAPVYWLFGKLLKISLPGLTGTGWL